MKTNFEGMIKEMSEFLKNEAKAETIIGKEFKLGQFNCVPVLAIGMGFGGGEGEGTGESKKTTQGSGGLGGAGMGISPIGFLVSHNDDIRFITVKSPSAINTAFEKVPDVLTKYFESRKKETAELV